MAQFTNELFRRQMAVRFGGPSALPQGGGVPANALTSKTGDVLTDRTGAFILTGKAA